MASLLDLYGSLYRPQTGSADAQDETTGGILDQYNRNRAYDNSVFGQVTGWLNKQRRGLEDATPFNPVVMALDGAQTMTNWMGASAFPEKVEPVDMLAPLGMAAVGSLATPRNAVGIFGGRLARTADQDALARAETMAAEGAPREQIWNDTGWFQGVDGKWRFEIDDSQMSFDGASDRPAPFRSFFVHPELEMAYPRETRDPVVFSGALRDADGAGALGGVDSSGRMYISKSADDPYQVAVHEMQHKLQDREGFASGGDARSYRDWMLENRPPRPIDVELDDQYRHLWGWGPLNKLGRDALKRHEQWTTDLKDSGKASDFYRRLAGEVEARTTQKRLDMDAFERRARPPWLDYDVPEADQIVRFEGGARAMADQSRGSMPTTAAERADMLAKNRMELGLSLINGDMETAAALRQQREAIQMHPLDGYAGMSPKFRGANVDGKMVVEGGTASENDRLFGPGKWVFYSNADRSSLPGFVAGAVDGESESEFDRLLRLYGFIQ